MFAVEPGISASKMHAIWEAAKEAAHSNPGVTVTIHFTPGDYPLPEPGELAYTIVPTIVHAAYPGMEVRFTYHAVTGKMHIDTIRKPGIPGPDARRSA